MGDGTATGLRDSESGDGSGRRGLVAIGMFEVLRTRSEATAETAAAAAAAAAEARRVMMRGRGLSGDDGRWLVMDAGIVGVGGVGVGVAERKAASSSSKAAMRSRARRSCSASDGGTCMGM